jgi:prepilin-type N-terminal cleavage/methylation domain-containing protein
MRPRLGMTLMEVIVALMISVLTLSIGYSAFATLIDQRTRLRTANMDTARAAHLRRTLLFWLRGAHLITEDSVPTFVGADFVRGRVADDKLTIVTNAETLVDENESIVHLYVQHGSDEQSRGLTVEARGLERNGVIRKVLDRTVGGMKIEYLSSSVQPPQWVTKWSSSTQMPRGLRLTLLPAEGDSLAPLLRLPIVLRLDQVR